MRRECSKKPWRKKTTTPHDFSHFQTNWTDEGTARKDTIGAKHEQEQKKPLKLLDIYHDSLNGGGGGGYDIQFIFCFAVDHNGRAQPFTSGHLQQGQSDCQTGPEILCVWVCVLGWGWGWGVLVTGFRGCKPASALNDLPCPLLTWTAVTSCC